MTKRLPRRLVAGPLPSAHQNPMKPVYLDYNATTPLAPPALEAMLPYLRDHYGNPSSFHSRGARAKKGLEEAREVVAGHLRARPQEIVFTGGGSEAINLAIKGLLSTSQKPAHILSCVTEHKAVLETLNHLRKESQTLVTLLPVDAEGQIDLDQLRAEIRKETVLLAFMWANNETGVLHPIHKIGEIARGHKIPFFCDAVQAVGKIPIHLDTLPVDLMAFSAHKFYGPKGMGGLYVGRERFLPPLVHGGHQERGYRGGTENVAGAVGMAAALGWVKDQMGRNQASLKAMRDRLATEIRERISRVKIHAEKADRLVNTLNVSFLDLEGQSLLMAMDQEGICVSQGAACASGAIDPSPILLAMGLSPEEAKASVRISLGYMTRSQEIDFFLDVLPGIVKKIREG